MFTEGGNEMVLQFATAELNLAMQLLTLQDHIHVGFWHTTGSKMYLQTEKLQVRQAVHPGKSEIMICFSVKS